VITLRETKQYIVGDPENWVIYLMDFVDDFRYYKNPDALRDTFVMSDERMDAMLASTASQLCKELDIVIPDWLWQVPSCKDPWFVSGMESLRALTLVQSPMYFRLRKIFVLENFLNRV
jgi:hypothetical protein